MTTRQYEFIVGPETAALPAAGTPSAAGDLITKGYADEHYVQGRAGLADLAALKAVDDGDLTDKDVVFVESLNTLYRYDASSVTAGDDNMVVEPTSGTGRWLKVTQGRTGDLVGTSDTQTLTNKTLTDSTTTIQDESDNTKKFKFQASGVSAGQTRTLTVPDFDGTLATRAGTEILTNKDIDGATASNSSRITLPKAATATLSGLTRKQGTILYDSDTDQVLYDDGSTLNALSAASTATPSALGLVTSYYPVIRDSVLVSSSATINLTTTDGYKEICLTLSGSQTVNLPAAADNEGRILEIKHLGASGDKTIDPNSTETIGGGSVQVLKSTGSFIRIYCDGSNWLILAVQDHFISTRARGGDLGLSSGTPDNVTSFSVPPGIWDLAGFIEYRLALATTFSSYQANISVTSGTIDGSQSVNRVAFEFNGSLSNYLEFPVVIPNWRTANLTASTTHYLVASLTFASSTAQVYGSLVGRRVG